MYISCADCFNIHQMNAGFPSEGCPSKGYISIYLNMLMITQLIFDKFQKTHKLSHKCTLLDVKKTSWIGFPGRKPFLSMPKFRVRE